MSYISQSFSQSMIIDGSNFVPNGGFWNNSNKSRHLTSVNYDVADNLKVKQFDGGLGAAVVDKRWVSNAAPATTYDCDGITVDERIFCLTGPFFPLSNYYATPIFIKNRRYRSVEHYVYEKFLRYLKLSEKYFRKIATTADPSNVPIVAAKFIPQRRFSQLSEEERAKLVVWYDRAIRKKLKTYEVLRQLLISTGNSLLIETNNHEYDNITTAGISETEIYFLLTRLEVNVGTILRCFCRKHTCDDSPANIQTSLRRLGENLTGIILMRLRSSLQNRHQNKILPSFWKPNLIAPKDLAFSSSSIVCFTDESVFHPKYLSPFWMLEDPYLIYPTVNHFIYAEASRFFCFPKTVVDILMQQPADEVVETFHKELCHRYPDPLKFYNWQIQALEQSILVGCRSKFELHADLLRCLLDTGDALLVHCHRYSTTTSEWNAGMREFELREWMRQSGMSCMDLATLMMADPLHRPPFLGGNRLGFLLMLLRKEFRNRPTKTMLFSELSTRTDVAFGECSGLETGDDFDSNRTPSKFLLWPNPYVLSIKSMNKRIWYPRKRRLPGYYTNGTEIETKRTNLHPAYMLHPEYAIDACVSRNLMILPEAIELHADKPYSLIDMSFDLIQKAKCNVDMLKQQEAELACLLDELHERNDVELKYGPMIRFEKSHRPNGIDISKNEGPIAEEKDGAKVASTVATATLGAKLAAVKFGFEEHFLDKARECLSGPTIYNIFDSIFDSNSTLNDTKAKLVVDRLYKHLTDQQKPSALTWLTHAVFRMKELHANSNSVNEQLERKISSSDASNWPNSDEPLKYFVPPSTKKSKIRISHSLIFEEDDLDP